MKQGGKTPDGGIFLFLIMAIILAAGGFIAARIIRSDPIEEALAGKNIINILFVLEGKAQIIAGTANKPEETESHERPLGAYVLMYTPENNRAAVISIPGDVGMILKSVDRVDRIDSVYKPKNIKAFVDEIEGLLGLKIDYSLVIEQEKLGKIVDIIEGVELFIPRPIEIYDDIPVLFPSGNTVLDGDKAKQYVCFEIPEEDKGQAYFRRERFFLGLLKSLGEKNSRFENPQLEGAFYPLLTSKMNNFTRKQLFKALAALDINRVSIQSVTGNYRQVSGQELLFPYYDGSVIKDIVRQTHQELSRENLGGLAERVFTVEILNGTTTTGLATRTAELIRGFRYDVVSTGNADRNDYEKTEIVDGTGLEDAAQAFAGTIKCKNIRYGAAISELDADSDERLPEYKADFTLIIGKDFNGRTVTEN